MTEQVPTLAEWAGGPEAIAALTKRFYEKVPQDSVLPEKRLEPCSKERVGNVVLDGSCHLTTVVNAVGESIGATEISEIDDLSVSPQDRPSNRGTKERIELTIF